MADKLYLAMDIGASNVRSAVTPDFERIQYFEKKGLKKGHSVEEEVTSAIIQRIVPLEQSGKRVCGLGLSLAALMDRTTGTVMRWPNHPLWEGFPLLPYLEEHLKIPVMIEDDANSGAWGMYLGLRKDRPKNFAYLSIGSGLGCGLVLNHALYLGDTGCAGELGHVQWKTHGGECPCGNRGCLQLHFSGPAMQELLRQSQEEWYRAARYADSAVSKAIEMVSTVIYNLSMLMDIHSFGMGGGVGKRLTPLIELILQAVNQKCGAFKKHIQLLPDPFGEHSGVYGALMLLHKAIEERCCN